MDREQRSGAAEQSAPRRRDGGAGLAKQRRRNALHDRVLALREARIANGGRAVPDQFQGIDKTKISQVLQGLDFEQNADLVDAVFAFSTTRRRAGSPGVPPR